MAKISLTNLSSPYIASGVTTYNANLAALRTAIENTLSRDGTSPNQMNADLDLNNYDLLNAGTIDADTFILNGETLVPADLTVTSASLLALSALTPAANKFPYFTGASAAALTDITSAGRALLDDADSDTQLVTLGGGTAGINALKADNAYTLRSLTEPSIILSQVDASGFEAKWTAALAVIAAAGGGKIIIDSSANVASILTTISSSHNNLIVEGTHSGVTLTASSPIIRFMTITGSNITFRNIAFAMGGNITSGGIQIQGSGVTFDNITAYNTVTTGGVGFLSTFGSGATDLRVMNSYFHTLGGSCITVQSGAARIRVMNNRATNIGQRFYYQTATTADIEHVIVTGNRIYDTASSGSLIQAAYTVGGAYRTRFINISDNEIIDEGAATGSSDTIVFHGAEHGVIANNVIRRPSDVGISVTYQSLGINVVGNQISYADLSGIDFGAHTTNGGVSNCHAVGNVIYAVALDRDNAHTYHGYVTAYDSSWVSFVGNRMLSDATYPAPYEAMFWDCSNVIYRDNSPDSAYTVARFGLPGTISFREIDGTYPGEPTMASGAPAGQYVYDSTAGRGKMWNGTEFRRASFKRFYARSASTGVIASSENVTSCNHSATGTYVYTLSSALSSTEAVVNVVTANTAAARDTEVVVNSTTQITIYIFSSGATLVDLAHSFSIID